MIELTDDQRDKFLAAIEDDRAIGNRAAMKAAGVTVEGANGEPRPPTGAEVKQLLAANPDLRDEYERARGRHPERVRAAIVERAIDGVDEPWHVRPDGQVLTRRVFSDRLLSQLAKATLPEYRDTQRLELTGADGAPVEIVAHERRLTLAHVLALRDPRDGLGAGDRRELAPAGEILPAPDDDLGAAGEVPAAPEP